MQIVIDIPEKVKQQIDENLNACTLDMYDCVMLATKNGKPLPKGHGDLIDRNSILCDDCSCEQCGHTDECFKLLAPTIIEAEGVMRSDN